MEPAFTGPVETGLVEEKMSGTRMALDVSQGSLKRCKNHVSTTHRASELHGEREACALGADGAMGLVCVK